MASGKDVYDELVDAAMDMIRLATPEAERDPATNDRRRAIVDRVHERNGVDSLQAFALVLARTAAAGFGEVARRAGGSLDDVLTDYRSHLEVVGIVENYWSDPDPDDDR